MPHEGLRLILGVTITAILIASYFIPGEVFSSLTHKEITREIKNKIKKIDELIREASTRQIDSVNKIKVESAKRIIDLEEKGKKLHEELEELKREEGKQSINYQSKLYERQENTEISSSSLLFCGEEFNSILTTNEYKIESRKFNLSENIVNFDEYQDKTVEEVKAKILEIIKKEESAFYTKEFSVAFLKNINKVVKQGVKKLLSSLFGQEADADLWKYKERFRQQDGTIEEREVTPNLSNFVFIASSSNSNSEELEDLHKNFRTVEIPLSRNKLMIFALSGGLIFLESAVKKKTIQSFLGENYVIFATSGHLQELKKSGIYNLGYLKRENISSIYLATDPDREGEAIAQEVVLLLELSPGQYRRLLFYEITPRNINEALSKPLELNDDLVEAQVSRQVLDRMIGFCLSTMLQKKLRALSAGRVQSVVLKLIVEREFLIKNYEKKKDYIICGTCQVKEKKIILKQVNESGELIVYKNKIEAEEVKNKLSTVFQLVNKKEEQKFIFPKSSLITSLLLFEAKSQLGFSVAQTTQTAQKLYEDAHESIHPTYLDYHPEEIKSSLTEEEYQLYKLIFNHTLASLMSPAKVNKITYTFSNNNYLFATTERICQFTGFLDCSLGIYLTIYNVKLKSEIADHSKLEAKKIEVQEYTDNKPVRYNEGSIVQELEKLGIGRPSTYNTFGRILLKRNYVEQDKKGHFIPTELGIAVNK
ncbi:6956_t:CDS:2 [Ambispora leptoticha]|uniref:DNA topoisomerase n=1 Tax=Ambispora leptoticha TaxID=144679 RepID=A0A9N8V545_9GLOM|nr:6956_t:CDS:2 [Ambispora leptoticha]